MKLKVFTLEKLEGKNAYDYFEENLRDVILDAVVNASLVIGSANVGGSDYVTIAVNGAQVCVVKQSLFNGAVLTDG